MIKEINHIVLSEETLPIRLDNLVLQKVQEKYESVVDFEMKMMGWSKTEEGELKITSEPSIEVLNWVLPQMVKEGYAVSGEECPYLDEDIIRLVDLTPLMLALKLHEEIDRCFRRKKKESQTQTKRKNLTKQKRTLKSILFGCI